MVVTLGHRDVVRVLLNHGADPNVKCNNNSNMYNTPLYIEAGVGKDCVKIAHVNNEDEYIDIITMLVESGANINHKNMGEITALHEAVDYKSAVTIGR